MSQPLQLRDRQTHIDTIDQLIDLADQGLKTMDPGVLHRLRSGAKQFIQKRHGAESHFNVDFKKIGNYDSLHTIIEIKGMLRVIKDDLQVGISDNHADYNSELTTRLLSLFNDHGIYNWEAVKNLILFDVDYFKHSVRRCRRIVWKIY